MRPSEPTELAEWLEDGSAMGEKWNCDSVCHFVDSGKLSTCGLRLREVAGWCWQSEMSIWHLSTAC